MFFSIWIIPKIRGRSIAVVAVLLTHIDKMKAIIENPAISLIGLFRKKSFESRFRANLLSRPCFVIACAMRKLPIKRRITGCPRLKKASFTLTTPNTTADVTPRRAVIERGTTSVSQKTIQKTIIEKTIWASLGRSNGAI